MSGKEDGIFISRRLVFIMIFVSLCVNVFFLLMGILIGKDDVKWKAQNGASELAQTQVQEDTPPRPSLDDELSMFESDVTEDRRPPIPTDALESKRPEPAPVEVNRQPTRPRETTTSTPRPQAEKPKPKPVAQKPKPPVNKPKPSTSGPAFWIQVMASTDRPRAEEFLRKVKANGFGAVMVNEGAFYKIRVGPYRDRPKADAAKSRVNSQLNVKGWIVKK